MIKAKTFYIVLGAVVILFIGLLYMQSNVELNSATDTIVKRWKKVTASAPAAVAPTPVVFVKEDAKSVKYLADANGMAMYTYANDKDGISNCTAQCLAAWPAVIVVNANITADGLATGALGTITTADGKLHLTYNGLPLYYYAKDAKAGDMMGNGMLKGAWKVAKP